MLKLFYSPGACSMSCHIALEEVGVAYEAIEINTKQGSNLRAEYLKINPLAKVPALEIDGDILTEAAAILAYIADSYPDKNLLPRPGTLARARAQEWLNFLSSTVHIAFRPVFRPERMVEAQSCVEDLRRTGVAAVVKALEQANARLIGKKYALGDNFSLCDGYLLVFFLWSRREQLAPLMPTLSALRATALRVLEREAVQAVIRAEGIQLPPL